jgi:hypothetical protein
LAVLPAACGIARAQAGRYIPIPRLPGGGFHFVPHIPFHGGDSDDSLVIVAVVAGIALVAVGWCVGRGLGRCWRGVPADAQAASRGTPQFAAPTWPPTQDLILSADDVADKSARTTRLLEILAGRDRVFTPAVLREHIHDTFCRVQHCWQEQNYGPVKDRLMPEVLAKHEALLREMRRNREINRIDDLHVRRLEFVHVACPAELEAHELTALITFEARVYFVHDRSGAFLRGARRSTWYQEFWTFRRDGDAWRLREIKQSWDGAPLMAANVVAGMSDADLRNLEQGVVLL